MSAKPRRRQLPITMFLTTPTPTNSRKKDGNTPMTRKRRRELEAEAGAGNDSAGAGSTEMDTPTRAGKRPKRSSKTTSKRTPGGKGKARPRQRNATDSEEDGERAGPSKPPTHRAVTRAARKAGNLLTPESEIIIDDDSPEDTGISSLKTPLAELRLGARRGSMESPLPQNARRGLRSSNSGLPTPIPSSRSVSKQKANKSSKILVRTTPEPPESEPIIISSSPLSPLTDLPDSSDSPPPQAAAQKPSPIFKVPALPHTPHRQRVENRQPGTNPPRNFAMAVDSDEGVVPTSQSQDLRPFVISPPRPGGSVLFKDTTPKSLRQSQGYVPQPAQPLPSVLATIQARGHVGTQETDIVPTSQMEEDELRIPDSVRAGTSRSLAFSSPDRRDNVARRPHELPSSERTGVLRTPTKITGLPRDGKVHVTSPVAALLFSPKRGSPTRRDYDGPSTSSLPPSSIPLSTDPPRSSRDDTALDFVQYQTTPTKRRSSFDSPRKELKLFESQTTISPTWSQPRSFERWRLRDILDSQRAFGDGKAGLEAEAEGREPGGSLGTDGEESQNLEKAAMMASSMTQPESQDLTEWILKAHPELRFAGKAPPYKSSSSSLNSNKSGSDSSKNKSNGSGSGGRSEQVGIIVIDDTPPPSQNSKKSDNSDPITNRIENVGMVSPVKTPSSLTESDSQSGNLRETQEQDESQSGGLGESALIFSQPSLDPLHAFLDIFEGASSLPQDSQL